MHTLKLTPRKLGFVIATRALLGVGLGLLFAGRLSVPARRALGAGLVALGGLTTIPAVRLLARAA